jgi:hypothetical protein
MNDRAIDVYKQALEFAYTTVGKEHADTAFFQGTVAGKLAELLIAQCDQICADVGTALYAEPNQDNLGTALTCAAAIKQHFGVKQ